MQKKPTASPRTTTTTTTRAPTKTAVREALARSGTALPADEEKALRMLNGASVPGNYVLERVGQEHPEAREKLLSIELQLLKEWKARQAATVTAAKAPAREPNARRSQIVSALKKKPTR